MFYSSNSTRVMSFLEFKQLQFTISKCSIENHREAALFFTKNWHSILAVCLTIIIICRAICSSFPIHVQSNSWLLSYNFHRIDHRICRKVSNIPNHPLRANFPETKITRYNLRNKSPTMPAIHMDCFKNTFCNRIVFKYNVAL